MNCKPTQLITVVKDVVMGEAAAIAKTKCATPRIIASIIHKCFAKIENNKKCPPSIHDRWGRYLPIRYQLVVSSTKQHVY